MPPFHSSRRERPRSLPRFLPARAPFPLLPLPLRLYLEMWHSTGLPRCLRWCGIRAGLPLRARLGAAGVPRGNDAQIGRIISKTTTLPPSSPPSPLPPSYLSHPAALSRLVFYVPRALSPRYSLAPSSPTVAKGWNTTPTAAVTVTAAATAPSPNNHPDCHAAVDDE